MLRPIKWMEISPGIRICWQKVFLKYPVESTEKRRLKTANFYENLQKRSLQDFIFISSSKYSSDSIQNDEKTYSNVTFLRILLWEGSGYRIAKHATKYKSRAALWCTQSVRCSCRGAIPMCVADILVHSISALQSLLHLICASCRKW